MHDQWQSGFPRRLDMQSKGFLLQLARRMLVEIIEAGLANADNFGMRGQFDELCRRYFIALTFRLMRMNTDGAMNIVILLRDRPDSVKLAEFCPDGQHMSDADRPRPRDHVVKLAGKLFKIQMAMAID